MLALKRCLIMGISMLFLGVVHGAQAQGEQNSSTKVVTNPVGAMVYIRGEYNLAGRAPYTVAQPLDGLYQLQASKRGFEDYSTTFRFVPGATDRISIRLTKKTRPRAFVRSMFIPGWGQIYSNHKTKGIFITAAQIGTLGTLIYEDSQYQKSVDEYNNAVRLYEENIQDSELREILYLQVKQAEVDVNAKYETRRKWIIIASSVYIYNLVDVLLFFPRYDYHGFSVGVAVDGNPVDSSVQVGFEAKF